MLPTKLGSTDVFRGHFNDAQKIAQSDVKFLCVLLCCSDHPSCRPAVLNHVFGVADPELDELVARRCLVWAADIDSDEGCGVSSICDPVTFPYFAVTFKNSILMDLQGDFSPQQLKENLQRCFGEAEPVVAREVAYAADRAMRDAERDFAERQMREMEEEDRRRMMMASSSGSGGGGGGGQYHPETQSGGGAATMAAPVGGGARSSVSSSSAASGGAAASSSSSSSMQSSQPPKSRSEDHLQRLLREAEERERAEENARIEAEHRKALALSGVPELPPAGSAPGDIATVRLTTLTGKTETRQFLRSTSLAGLYFWAESLDDYDGVEEYELVAGRPPQIIARVDDVEIGSTPILLPRCVVTMRKRI